jgi:hypothetical protein
MKAWFHRIKIRLGLSNSRRFIYVPRPASHREFIEFWAPRYYDAREELSTDNIRESHTDDTLRELFFWKEGPQYFNDKLPSINANFASKRQASGLPQDISGANFLCIENTSRASRK